MKIQLYFDFVSTEPIIAQESTTIETFSASNINDYIFDLQEKGEESFN